MLDEHQVHSRIPDLVVGRIDLTVAMGAASPDDARVIAAIDAVCAAGRRRGVVVGMFLSHPSDVPAWRKKGASFFLFGSDQSLLKAGAAALVEQATRD